MLGESTLTLQQKEIKENGFTERSMLRHPSMKESGNKSVCTMGSRIYIYDYIFFCCLFLFSKLSTMNMHFLVKN